MAKAWRHAANAKYQSPNSTIRLFTDCLPTCPWPPSVSECFRLAARACLGWLGGGRLCRCPQRSLARCSNSARVCPHTVVLRRLQGLFSPPQTLSCLYTTTDEWLAYRILEEKTVASKPKYIDFFLGGGGRGCISVQNFGVERDCLRKWTAQLASSTFAARRPSTLAGLPATAANTVQCRPVRCTRVPLGAREYPAGTQPGGARRGKPATLEYPPRVREAQRTVPLVTTTQGNRNDANFRNVEKIIAFTKNYEK